MIPKLPIYAKGDSMGIAVYPTGVSLEEVEIDMLVYTTGNGPRIYGSTQGSGLPIVKGTDRAVFKVMNIINRFLLKQNILMIVYIA